MSSATTIHDGCGDIVNLLLSCIILIVYENQTLLPLHMYLYFTFVTLFLLRKGEFFAKIRKLVGIRVRFYHFLYVVTQKTLNYLANRPWMLPVNGRFAPVLTIPPFLNKKA